MSGTDRRTDRCVSEAEDISRVHDLEPAAVERVVARYPALINPYYSALALDSGGPILRQVLPDPEELSPRNEELDEDPVGEDSCSPVPNLTHRYADRVLFLVSDRCPVLCRFCTRKRKVGHTLKVTEETVAAGIRYIDEHREIRDVLLSGGDPFMLERQELSSILERVRAIRHVEIIRIGTRVPAALPARVTLELAALLSRFAPIYVHTHFNHPIELSPPAADACRRLADAGIPLGNQTVLLQGINDDPDTLEALFRGLLVLRVRPYYLFQADLVRGTDHFRTPLERGIAIMEELHRRTSSMSLPRFAVDLPGGKGKVFPTRRSVVSLGRHGQAIVTPEGVAVPYPD